MKLLRNTFLIMSMIIGFSASAQQRALTSTYPFNGLLLNPAYAGSLNTLSAIMVHRKQWVNIEGAPTFNAFTVHNSFMSNQIGVGLAATHDKIGANSSSSVYGSYAYKIHTSAGVLAMGIQGGFDHRRFSKDDLNILDEDDRLLINNSKTTPNVGLGVYFANPYLYAGLSVPYVIENKTLNVDFGEGLSKPSEARESRYYYFTGGVILPLSNSVKISPSVLIRKQEESRLSYEFTGLLIFEKIAYAGLGVRNSGEFVFLAQLILNENIRVGYAYDANSSELGKSTTGSHEILLNYRITLHNFRKHPQCPVYF